MFREDSQRKQIQREQSWRQNGALRDSIIQNRNRRRKPN